MVGNSPEERKMFRVTPLHYVIFDEAHMLKNMNTQRYENLIRINVSELEHVTGTISDIDISRLNIVSY